jgi:putative FmdB family regulatory protein
MPIYEYECERCCSRFELKRRFGDDDGGVCPRCGSPARRLFSPAPIIFKGSGFYVTDSRKSGSDTSDKKS